MLDLSCVLTLDFETYYDAKTFSLSKLTTEEYVRDPRFEVIMVGLKWGAGKSVWVPKPLVAQTLHRIDWSKIVLLAHNAVFDCMILNFHFGIRPRLILDTMCMAKPWHADTGVALAKLAKIYSTHDKGNEVVLASGKRYDDFTPTELAAYGGYCCNDCDLEYEILTKLLPVTPMSEVIFIDRVVRCATEPSLYWDANILKMHYDDIVRRKETLLASIGNIASQDELSSNNKFIEVLERIGGRRPMEMVGTEEQYESYLINMQAREHSDGIAPYYFDIPFKYRDATAREKEKGVEGPVAVWALAKKDEEFLALQEIEYDLLQAVLLARLGTKSTIAETRAARMLDASKRGAFPISLQYYAAHTGRLGGSEKSNPQNFTKPVQVKESDISFLVMTPQCPEILIDLDPVKKLAWTVRGSYPAKEVTSITVRHALKGGPDEVLVVADASQIEARTVAWVAGQTDLVESFRQKKDVYSEFATSVFGYEVSKKTPVERFVGKTSVLGLGFGTGHAKLQKTLAIGQGDTRIVLPLSDCKRIVNTYRKDKYPMIPAFWKICEQAIQCMYEGTEMVFGPGGCLRTSKDRIWLPNGMTLEYKGLRVSEDGKGYRYWGKRSGYFQWVTIYGAKLTENIVQALARIIVSDAWVRVSMKYRVAMQVHDELVSPVKREQAKDCLEFMITNLRIAPSWAPDLPLDAEGDIGKCYADAK